MMASRMVSRCERPVDFVLDSNYGCAIDVERDLAQQSSLIFIMSYDVRVGLVELEHGELGIVMRRDAFIAEIAIDLVDAIESTDDQPFQIQFRRNSQEEVDVERIVMRYKRTRRRAAGNRGCIIGVSTST